VVGSVALVMGPSTGGIGRHVQTLVAGLIARRIRVDVYAPTVTATRFGLAATGARVRPAEQAGPPLHDFRPP